MRDTSASGADSAEVAFAIADAYQGRGLATALLAHLAAHAHAHGVTTFTASCCRRTTA